jgi:hypothetical protein
MQTDHRAFGIFRKELRARRWIMTYLAIAAGVFLVGPLFWPGQEKPSAIPLAAVLVGACAVLGVTLFSRQERDSARALLYHLPLSRPRILTAKLGTLLANFMCLLVLIPIVFAAYAAILSLRALTIDEILRNTGANGEGGVTVTVAVLACPVFALLGVIVSQHVRSVIVSLILTLLIAVPVAAIAAYSVIPNLLGADPGNRLFDRTWDNFLPALPRLAFVFLLLAALFCGWLYFLYCRTHVHELRPTPRALLAFVFGAAAIEATFTLVFTGWRDLAYLVFGI